MYYQITCSLNVVKHNYKIIPMSNVLGTGNNKTKRGLDCFMDIFILLFGLYFGLMLIQIQRSYTSFVAINDM